MTDSSSMWDCIVNICVICVKYDAIPMKYPNDDITIIRVKSHFIQTSGKNTSLRNDIYIVKPAQNLPQ